MSAHDSAPPHEPAPRERFEPPAAEMVVRGVFLALAAVLAGVGAATSARGSVPAKLVAAPLSVAAVLLGWAGLIHLGGGERFDDHTWV